MQPSKPTPPASEHHGHDKTHKHRIWLFRLVSVAILLAVLGGAGLAFRLQSLRAVAQAYSALDAADAPRSRDELLIRYPLPSYEENAIVLLARAGDSISFDGTAPYRPVILESGEWPETAPTDRARALMQDFLEANGEAYQLMDAALEQSACRIPGGFETVVQDQGLEFLSHGRTASRLLQLAAYERAVEGDTAGCVTVIEQGLRLTELLGDEPRYVSHLLRVALTTTWVEALPVLLRFCSVDEEALDRLRQAYRDAELPTRIVDIGRVEFAMGLTRRVGDSLDDRRSPAAPPIPGFVARTPLARKAYVRMQSLFGVRNRQIARYAELGMKSLALIELELPAAMNGRSSWEKELEAARPVSLSDIPALNYPVNLHVSEGQRLALLRCAQAITQVELYLLRHGGTPSRQHDLLRGIEPDLYPDDPFTGQKLAFETKAGGYRVGNWGSRFTFEPVQVDAPWPRDF